MSPIARALFGICLAATFGFSACRRSPVEAAGSASTPTLRIYVASTVAGALEPCGCTKDMLGGVDHMAALVEREARDAPNTLVVAAGPLLFLNPKLDESQDSGDLKAEALTSFAGTPVSSAPGANDWAGVSEPDRLSAGASDPARGNLGGATNSAAATVPERNG
jgi:hypothetical protein